MNSKITRSAASSGRPAPVLGALPAPILTQVFAYASALDGSGLDAAKEYDELEFVPSLLKKKSTDAKECSRIAMIVCTAGMAFLRPVAKAFRDAADEFAVHVHVEAFGLRPADATTAERKETEDDENRYKYPDDSFDA